MPKFNIRDTKKNYSDINNMVLKGQEVITFNAVKEMGWVSHLKTEYIDFFIDNLTFKPIFTPDERLGGYTIEIVELGSIYGEGETKQDAIENLISNIIEYLQVYLQKIDLYSIVEPIKTRVYVLKLLRCDGDRDKIRKALNL
jgi:predicted RNase H-like HicB family nuclease